VLCRILELDLDRQKGGLRVATDDRRLMRQCGLQLRLEILLTLRKGEREIQDTSLSHRERDAVGKQNLEAVLVKEGYDGSSETKPPWPNRRGGRIIRAVRVKEGEDQWIRLLKGSRSGEIGNYNKKCFPIIDRS